MLLDNVSFSTAPPNAAPVSVGDGYESIQDTPLVVYAPGILANDIDGDSLSLTASVVTGPSHGELLLHPDGGFKYIPNGDYVGTDSFSYLVSDGQLNSNVAHVFIQNRAVSPNLVNGSFEIGTRIEDAPFEQFRLDGWGATGGAFAFSSTNNGFSATDGSMLALFNGGNDKFGGAIVQTIATIPGRSYQIDFDVGIVVGSGWGPRKQRLGVAVDGSGPIFSQEINLVGSDWPARWVSNYYTFVANSSTTRVEFRDLSGKIGGLSAHYSDLLLDNVSIVENRVNIMPIALGQSITLSEGEEKRILLLGIDTEGDDLIYSVITRPEHGVLIGTAPDLIYRPNADFHGDDQFSFGVDDGIQESNRAIVSIRVSPKDTSGYVRWLESYGIGDPFSDDPDDDSVANAIEYVLGGHPLSGGDDIKLPRISNVTDSSNSYSPGLKGVVFSYRRTHHAKLDPSVRIIVQWSTDPRGPWFEANEAFGALTLETEESGDPSVELVRVFLPSTLAEGGKLFARLGVSFLNQ
jgi:hypothetical protein